MHRKTGGEVIIDALQLEGVERIFGIPGIHNLAVYDAIHDSRMKHVAARHEQGAGFMAIGHARTTGKPGVALVITGPGLANIATPMGQAYHDSVPLLVISSQVETSARHYRSGYLHEMKNSTYFASSVTKSSRCIDHGWQIRNAISEAYRLAGSGRPGPVHIEIPLDILQNVIEESDIDSCNVAAEPDRVSSFLSEDVEEVINLLKEAENPLILAGGGAATASREVRQLCEQLAIPTVTTCAGKGVIDERDPLSLGCRLHFPSVQKMLLESDLVLALGTELSPTDFWQRSLTLGKKLVCVNTDPAAFYNQRTADIGIKSEVKFFLSRLLKEELDLPSEPEERYRRVDEAIREARNSLPAVTGMDKELDLVSEMLKKIRSQIGDKGIFWADMTSPAYIAVSEYQTYDPFTFLHPVGFGTLGAAMPGAIGTLLATSGRRVCALAGDGGFQFTLQELAVASELKLPLPIIIWNDCGYGEIRRNQSSREPARIIAVEHTSLDYLALAKAYNMEGMILDSLENFEEVLEESFERKGPTIIEIKVKECLR